MKRFPKKRHRFPEWFGKRDRIANSKRSPLQNIPQRASEIPGSSFWMVGALPAATATGEAVLAFAIGFASALAFGFALAFLIWISS